MLPSVTAMKQMLYRAVHTMINVRHDNLVEIYGGKRDLSLLVPMEYVDGISILETIEMIGVEASIGARSIALRYT